jgi:glycolate oxidase FAD binding subunit
VGGMVAAGWSGPARANVGAVRDYVLGATLINGKGELLTFGGQVIKNVAGYDVSRLMVGAWGTLGLLTQVSLKVLPMPPAEATLRFVCDQATALRQLNRWGGQPLPLNASCWLQEQGQGTLYVRLRGAVAAVEAACISMSQQLGGKRMELVSTKEDWQACRNHTLPWMQSIRHSGLALWRFSVPATAPVLQLPEGIDSPLVEWHGALRWVQAPVQSGPAMRECALAAGGSTSLFIAEKQDGTSGGGGFGLKNDVLANLHQRIKESFDPAGILNPGRMATNW